MSILLLCKPAPVINLGRNNNKIDISQIVPTLVNRTAGREWQAGDKSNVRIKYFVIESSLWIPAGKIRADCRFISAKRCSHIIEHLNHNLIKRRIVVYFNSICHNTIYC